MTSFLLEASKASSYVLLAVLVLMLVGMLIFPSIGQKKRNQEYQNMLDNLKVGDKVQTIGGIVGKIAKITEKDGVKTMFLETGDKNNKMTIEFNVNAIAGIVVAPEAKDTSKTELKAEEKMPVAEAKEDQTEEAKQSETKAESNESENATTKVEKQTKTQTKKKSDKKSTK